MFYCGLLCVYSLCVVILKHHRDTNVPWTYGMLK
ncbi:hypothetical protein SEVIR_7G048450v4 [Setaria viridis]